MTTLNCVKNNSKKPMCPYAVGDVYVTFSATNPATRWADTTWELVTAGTFLVAGASSGTYKVGSTGGEAAHTLTINEMPFHGHPLLMDGQNGSLDTGIGWTWNKTANWQATSDTAPNSNNRMGGTGGGKPHNNLPPYMAVYMWKRTGGGAIAL